MTAAHAMPQLEFRPPLCPLCDEDLNYEDGWDCANCQMWWHENGQFGERFNTDKPLCGAEHAPHVRSRHETLRKQVYRCMLDQDHEGRHRGVRIDQATGDVHDWREATAAARA
jgi:hypothetical protein